MGPADVSPLVLASGAVQHCSHVVQIRICSDLSWQLQELCTPPFLLDGRQSSGLWLPLEVTDRYLRQW